MSNAFVSSYPRIGLLNENGRPVRWPREYVDESPFDKEANEAPTVIKLDAKHFAVMPVGIGFLPFNVREQLKQEAKEFDVEMKEFLKDTASQNAVDEKKKKTEQEKEVTK